MSRLHPHTSAPQPPGSAYPRPGLPQGRTRFPGSSEDKRAPPLGPNAKGTSKPTATVHAEPGGVWASRAPYRVAGGHKHPQCALRSARPRNRAWTR